MELSIFSPTEKSVYKILWLEVETAVGGMTIQKGHAPTIVELLQNSNLSFCLSNTGKVEIITVPGGFMEVTRESVNILLT